MITCTHCHQEIPDNAQFCSNCAAPVVRSNETSQLAVPSDPTDDFVGKSIDHKYLIQKRIASGGMGVVYLARQKGVGQEVAVKKLHADKYSDSHLVERFINEARSYGKISHPNAVKLHDLLNVDGQICIIMEFVHGRTLTSYIEANYIFTQRQIIDISMQLADALWTVHQAGIIHRDLKTENVMLIETVPGRFSVKILDFGIAKMLDRPDSKATLEGTLVGTPEFMSPEQCYGETIDGRTDIYAFGILMFIMICGYLPFEAETAVAVLHKQAHEPVPKCTRPDKSDVSPDLEAIVQKCLMKKVDERYQSFAEVIEDLMALQEGRPTTIAHSDIQPVVEEEKPEEPEKPAPAPSKVSANTFELDVDIDSQPVDSEGDFAFSISDDEDSDDKNAVSKKDDKASDEENDEPEFSGVFAECGEYSLGELPGIEADDSVISTASEKRGKAGVLPGIVVVAAALLVIFFGLTKSGMIASEALPDFMKPAASPEETVVIPTAFKAKNAPDDAVKIESDAPEKGNEEAAGGQDAQEVAAPAPEPEVITPAPPSQAASREAIERGIARSAMKKAETLILSAQLDTASELLDTAKSSLKNGSETDAGTLTELNTKLTSFKDIMAQADKAKKSQNCKTISNLAESSLEIDPKAEGIKTQLDKMAQKCNAVLAAPPTSL